MELLTWIWPAPAEHTLSTRRISRTSRRAINDGPAAQVQTPGHRWLARFFLSSASPIAQMHAAVRLAGNV